MNSEKAILFLSALDFKEKSIQVIRKTPEAYLKRGWKVYYIVGRDRSKYGNYYYEKELNLEGIHIIRFDIPLYGIYDSIRNNGIRTVISKIRGYLAAVKLFVLAVKVLKSNRVDIIYGYEIQGVLAVNLLRLFGRLKSLKIVSRFQGTFFNYYITQKRYLKVLLNWEHLLALYLPSHLCIMTNDGTQGDQALYKIRSKNLRNLKFWVNGVDEQKLPIGQSGEVLNKFHLDPSAFILLTICRLEHWKRVDRGIKIVSYLVHSHGLENVKYLIVGEGYERANLEALSRELKVSAYIEFVGAVPNEEVKKYLNAADCFLSTYDSSNVGNPLLEAIRANKIIFTLDNGDTKVWIEHNRNGFIYTIDEHLEENIARDISSLIKDSELRTKILRNIAQTETDKLWTWEQRYDAEISEVERLLK